MEAIIKNVGEQEDYSLYGHRKGAILEAAKEGFGHQRSPIRMSLQRRRRQNEAITTQPDNLRNDGQEMQG